MKNPFVTVKNKVRTAIQDPQNQEKALEALELAVIAVTLTLMGAVAISVTKQAFAPKPKIHVMSSEESQLYDDGMKKFITEYNEKVSKLPQYAK